MSRARLTTEPDGRVCLESPYSPSLVDALKAGIPRGGREWEPARKRWLISSLYIEELQIALLLEGITCQDDRAQPETRQSPAALDMPADLAEAFSALFLAPNAPLVVAEASWKALSRLYHPDNPQYGNAEIAVRLNEAITIIRRYLAPTDDEDIPF